MFARTLVASVACWLSFQAPSRQPMAAAQGRSSSAALQRASSAVVKIVAVGSDGRGSTGSGVVVGGRGYILTNFHVIGEITPRRGTPGALSSSNNRVYVTFSESVFPPGRQRWAAAVVRGDVRRDLALLRIVTDANGVPVDESNFPAIEISSGRNTAAGTGVWALGFPAGSRQVRDTGLAIAAVETNAAGAASWLRLRGGVDLGYSGGGLVDANGRLIGLLTAEASSVARGDSIRRARPISIVPTSWLQAARNGRIQDVRIEGVTRLRSNTVVNDVAWGDATSGDDESHFYLLPTERPLTLRTTPELPMSLWDARGRRLRAAQGLLQVKVGDPRGVVLSIDFAAPTLRGSQGVRYSVVAQSGDGSNATGRSTPPNRPSQPIGSNGGNMGEMGLLPNDSVRGTTGESDNPFFTLPSTQRLPAPSNADNPSTVVRGRLIDAITGRIIPGGTFVIGQPGVDMRNHLSAFLSGRMSEQAFRSRLLGSSRSDIYGRFELTGLPRGGGTFPAAVTAPGYAAAILPVRARWHDRTVDLGSLQLTR